MCGEFKGESLQEVQPRPSRLPFGGPLLGTAKVGGTLAGHALGILGGVLLYRVGTQATVQAPAELAQMGVLGLLCLVFGAAVSAPLSEAAGLGPPPPPDGPAAPSRWGRSTVCQAR